MSQTSRIPVDPAAGECAPRRPLTTDILILSDGTVLAHNLTPGMATVLHQLNPQDETFGARARCNRKPPVGLGAAAPAKHSI
ncbi:MAG: hypothetical protein WCL11_22975 [Verrucomicrobiota bacterium]